MFKKLLSIILVYLMTIPINYLPYISLGILHAKKYRVTIINIEADGNPSFSKRMTQFLKDELETKNRIEYFKHNIQIEEKTEVKKEEKKTGQRTFDESKFEEIANIKNEIKQQVKDKEYSMLIESWQQIIDTYEENFDNLKTMQPLFEAYVNKAYYEGLDEMDDEAKADIKTAISIGRNFTFDPKGFSPRFLVKYKRERKRSKKKSKATITLNAPSDHELIIDGISMGNAPVKVTELTYGKHFVVVLDSAKKVVKKKIFEFTKRKKDGKITIKSQNTETKKEIPQKEEKKEKTDSQILTEINLSLSKDEFNEDLKNNLDKFAKKVKADFIVFGNSTKKHDMYNAKIYLYNAETKTISFLTKGEFDSDLLTGDVEGLRIGNEIVKGIDNFSSLKPVVIKKKTVKKVKKVKKASLRIVPFVPYKELKWGKPAVIVSGDSKENTVVAVKKDNDDNIDLDSVDTVKEDKNDKKDIDIADADYSKLDDDLDKYNEDKKDDDGAWYTEWWVWTIVGVVVVGATAGTVYVLTKDNDSTQTTIPGGTWELF